MKPRAHTDISPHSRHQRGLLHMLSRGRCHLEVIINKKKHSQSHGVHVHSPRDEASAGSLVLLHLHSRDSLPHLSRSALRSSRPCSCTVQSVCHTGRRSHIHIAAGSRPRTDPRHTLCRNSTLVRLEIRKKAEAS